MNGSIITHDLTGGHRLALALLLALGLHVTLFLGVPITWPSLHRPAPQRLDIVLLLPAERLPLPQSSSVAPELAQPEIAPAASAVTPPTSPPTVIPPDAPPPPPVAVHQPTLRPPAVKRITPAKSPKLPTPKSSTVAIIAPLPRRPASRPAEPPKRAESVPLVKPNSLSKSAQPKPAKPIPSAQPTLPAPSVKPVLPAKPDQPATSPTPVERQRLVVKTPARRLERSAGMAAANPSVQLDSSALLGQIASLETENQRRANAGVRRKRVSPNDTQSLEGFYIAAWIRKVERIGEINFPETAHKLNLTTGPVLDVHIRADGSLSDIRVARSSGNAELDQAAQRIVRLGEPYAPFPAELRQKWDVLQISRPWRFDAGGQFQAR